MYFNSYNEPRRDEPIHKDPCVDLNIQPVQLQRTFIQTFGILICNCVFLRNPSLSEVSL